MSVLVPDFSIDDGDEYLVLPSTELTMVEDEITTLLWQDACQKLAKTQSPPYNYDDTTVVAASGEVGVAPHKMIMATSSHSSSIIAGMGGLAPMRAASQLRVQTEKRKDSEWLTDKDSYVESGNAEEQVANSTSTKRSRCENVHNLSERRRRERINGKMMALQELIPRSTKADKASLLDEAIEYVKSLQLRVKSLQLQVQNKHFIQMMSTGCGMVPVVFPGVHPCVPCMNMGTAMDAGVSCPRMPLPNILASLMIQPSANGAHLGPGFPISTFGMQQETPNQLVTPSPNYLDPTLSSLMIQNMSQQFPVNANAYQQQHPGLPHIQ